MSLSEVRMVGGMSSSGTQSYGRRVEIRTESDLEDNMEHLPRYPMESMFPEALNKKLKDDVDVLQCENARLKKSLREAETKAEMKLNDLPSPLKSLGRSSDLAASKIVELSKKVRELSAKLGAAENKANSAEAQLNVYMASQNINLNNERTDNEPNDNVNDSEREQQLKELTEKLNAANNKLCESRNQVQTLKQELKVVQKALINEVGDETSAASILAGNANNWRGRAQQILSLQQKVAELQNKLSATDVLGKEKSALSLAVSEKHAEKEKVAALTKELEALREELADFKSKGEAAKARIKVLSTDLNSNKIAFQSLQTKNNNDEQTIAKLTNQLTSLMEKAQERENNITRQLNNRIEEMSKELRQEKTKCEQLKEIIADRDQKISKLEERLKVSNLGPAAQNGSFPDDPSPHGFGSTPVHDHQLRPISRCSSVDRQSTASSGAVEADENKENRRIDYEKNGSTTSTAYHDGLRRPTPTAPSLQTTEAERLRLMELATVLNRRVEQERKEHDRALDELRKERQRGAKLEMKLAKLEMEKIGGSRATYYRSNSTPSTAKSAASPAEIETMKDKCELLQEKCLALEARLETTRREKEEEARMYRNILEETRQALKEHIRPVKSSCWSSTSLP